MIYPRPACRVTDPAAAIRIMRADPFAHFITGHETLRATRIPFIVDCENGRLVRLRAHLDRRNTARRD